MEIAGYRYLYHRIVKRKWGVELAFGVEKDGRDINDQFLIDDPKADEKQLQELISLRLAKIDIVHEEVVTEKLYTENEVKELLVSKGYLTEEQSIDDLKTKEDLIKETPN